MIRKAIVAEDGSPANGESRIMSKQDKPIIPEFWYRICPELRYFESRDELRQVKKAFRERASKRRGWSVVLFVAVVAGGLSWVAMRWLLSFGLSVWLATIIITVLCMLLGVSVSLFAWQRPYIRFLRQYLQDHGVAVCLRCGYDLRGQTEPRCPECGTEFDPALLGRFQIDKPVEQGVGRMSP